jgi:hypothetical protein
MHSRAHGKRTTQSQKLSMGALGATAAMAPHAFGLTKAAYSVNETLEVLSIGRTSLYKLVHLGLLTPIKVGRKTLFGSDDLAALLVKLRSAL